MKYCTCGYGPVSQQELDDHYDYMLLTVGDNQSEHQVAR